MFFQGFLVVFLGFYSGFELLTTKTIVKTRKNHQNSILRDSLKMVFFVFCFSWFLQWFCGVFSRFFGGFLGFYSGFELLITKTAVNTKNNHELQVFQA